MGAGEDAGVLADDLSLGGDDDALGIDPHADRAVGEGRRHAVAIALEMDQAGRRDALGVFDKAVERPGKLHQVLRFFAPGVGDRARLRAVRRLGPTAPGIALQPVVERRQGGEARGWLPEPMAGVLDVLLDLPLLPAEAGLQNSASNRKWLTMAEKRALTLRSLPRPTLSTAVRMLS